MATDKAKDRAKRWVSRMERGKWEPLETERGTDKARETERRQENHGERAMEILWGKGEAPMEKQMGRDKERVGESGRS